MANPPKSNLSAGDIARSLLRHSKKSIAIFCLVVTATICWIIFVPGEYESTAKIYVRVGRENNTLDPSATTGQTVNIKQSLESEINSMLEILESRETVRRVVSDIGVDLILANDITDDGSSAASKSSGLKIEKWISNLKGDILPARFSESDEERAMRVVLKRSAFWAPKKSNVLEISCRAGHPELAQRIANSWISAFTAEHLRVSRTEGSLSFFMQQVEENASQLRETENELKEAKSLAGLVSVEGQRTVLEDQSKSIRLRLLANDSALAASQAKIEQIETILESLPDRVDSDRKTNQSHRGWNDLRGKLFELQIREHELKSKYSQSSAQVIAVVQQREAIEKILAAQSKSSSELMSEKNPTHLLFEQNLLNEKAQVASLLAEKKSLENQKRDNLKEFSKLNENAIRIDDLNRLRTSLEESYLASFARMEQSKILRGLEMANISSASRLQNASFNSRPVGLGRLKTLLLGIFLGVIAGLGFAFVAEYFDRSFVTPRQVEHALDVPVLVSIPEVRRQLIEVG